MYHFSDDNKLRKDVELFVKTKIKDIKCVDDICVDFFDVSKLTNINNSYNHLNLIKKIFQITLNTYNHYDTFKDMRVKFLDDDTRHLIPLSSFYNYDHKTNTWKCKCRPDEEDLRDALYSYVLYFKSLQFSDDGQYDNIKIDKCNFCDNFISNEETVCTFCDTSLYEMKVLSKKLTKCDINKSSDNKIVVDRLDTEIKEDINLPLNVQQESIKEDINLPLNVQQESIKEDINLPLNVQQESIKEDENVRQWSCSKCSNPSFPETIKGIYDCDNMMCDSCVKNDIHNTDGNINTEGMMNCVCDEYSLDNSIIYIQRSETFSINNAGYNLETQEMNTKWKCKICNLLNSYDTKECQACHNSMKENGLWICTKCRLENMLINSKCEACLMDNENLRIKFCQLCKLNQINIYALFCQKCVNESKTIKGPWMCRYVKCGASCKMNEDFCNYCGLWKYTDFSSLNRGQAVRRRKKGKETTIWICNQCYTFVNTSFNVCSNWICWMTRYKKKQCNNCLEWSNGKSPYCRRCKVII